MAESFRESKVLIGFPTSGLGFLSSQSSRASVEKDLSEHGEEGANAAVSSRLVRSVPNGLILGERLSVSAADFLKNNVKPRELGHCQSPQKDQSEEKEKENVPAHLLKPGLDCSKDKLVCHDCCRLKRASDVNLFMVECHICKNWFHGKCVGVCQRDVSGEDVIWVCSNDCEEDVPMGWKIGKKILVGHPVPYSASRSVKPLAPPSRKRKVPPSRSEDLSGEVFCGLKKKLAKQLQDDSHEPSCTSGASGEEQKMPNLRSPAKISLQLAQMCIEHCKFGRSAEKNQFMVECEGCKQWFHGKCVQAYQSDVSGDDVIWLCSADCEEDIPVGLKIGKKLLVGQTRVKQSRDRSELNTPSSSTAKIRVSNAALVPPDRGSTKFLDEDNIHQNPVASLTSLEVMKQDDLFPVQAKTSNEEDEKSPGRSREPIPNPSLEEKSDAELWCRLDCLFNRAAKSGKFMVECCGCNRWFHGKCVRVRERDVVGDDVEWLCSSGCEKKLPVDSKAGKKLVIGPTFNNEKTQGDALKPHSSSDTGDAETLGEADKDEKDNSESTQGRDKNGNYARICRKPKNRSTEDASSDLAPARPEERKQAAFATEESVTIVHRRLSKFLNVPLGSITTRTKVNASVLGYLKNQHLIDKSDSSFCVPDRTLKSVFDLPERCTLKKLAKKVKALLQCQSTRIVPSDPQTPKFWPRTCSEESSAAPSLESSQPQGHTKRLFHKPASHSFSNIQSDFDDDIPLFATPKYLVEADGVDTFQDPVQELAQATDFNDISDKVVLESGADEQKQECTPVLGSVSSNDILHLDPVESNKGAIDDHEDQEQRMALDDANKPARLHLDDALINPEGAAEDIAVERVAETRESATEHRTQDCLLACKPGSVAEKLDSENANMTATMETCSNDLGIDPDAAIQHLKKTASTAAQDEASSSSPTQNEAMITEVVAINSAAVSDCDGAQQGGSCIPDSHPTGFKSLESADVRVEDGACDGDESVDEALLDLLESHAAPPSVSCGGQAENMEIEEEISLEELEMLEAGLSVC